MELKLVQMEYLQKRTIVFWVFQENHRVWLVGVLRRLISWVCMHQTFLEAIETDCCFKNNTSWATRIDTFSRNHLKRFSFSVNESFLVKQK